MVFTLLPASCPLDFAWPSRAFVFVSEEKDYPAVEVVGTVGNSAQSAEFSKRSGNGGKHAVSFPRFPRRGSFHNLGCRELSFSAPTAWSKLQYMTVMQQAIEHGAYGRGIT